MQTRMKSFNAERAVKADQDVYDSTVVTQHKVSCLIFMQKYQSRHQKKRKMQDHLN